MTGGLIQSWGTKLVANSSYTNKENIKMTARINIDRDVLCELFLLPFSVKLKIMLTFISEFIFKKFLVTSADKGSGETCPITTCKNKSVCTPDIVTVLKERSSSKRQLHRHFMCHVDVTQR